MLIPSMGPQELANFIEVEVRQKLSATAGAIMEARIALQESWQAQGTVLNGVTDQEYKQSVDLVADTYNRLGDITLRLAVGDDLLGTYVRNNIGIAAGPAFDPTAHTLLPPHNTAPAEPKKPKSKKEKRLAASEESDINAQAIKAIANEYFGELTSESDALLHYGPPVSPVRLAGRQDKIETVTHEETQKLFEAITVVAANSQGLNGVSLNEIIANSYTVGIGFGLLPSSPKKLEGSDNETRLLREIQDKPHAWLVADPDKQRVVFTAEAHERLQAAYIDNGGCPAIGLRVQGSTGSSDLFVLYWGVLAARYEQ